VVGFVAGAADAGLIGRLLTSCPVAIYVGFMTRTASGLRRWAAHALIAFLAVMTCPAPSRSSQGLRFGLSLGNTLPGLEPAALDRELTDLASLGVTTIRIDLDWNDVSPSSPSALDWSDVTRVIDAAGEHHLDVLAVVTHSPRWARDPACTNAGCPPADPHTYAEFLTAAVRQLQPHGVRLWELWNEPNQPDRWFPAADPAAYAALLAQGAAAIHDADPAATVLSGGLAPADTAAGAMAPSDFLSDICAYGALSGVDGVAFHPYSFPVPPAYAAPWNAWAQLSATPRSLARVLAECGQPRKIWVTEYGAPTNGPGVGATPADLRICCHPDHVDEALQAELTSDVVAVAAHDPNISSLYWYSYRDIGTSTVTAENFYGLRRYDGSPKPAWSALAAAIGAYRSSGR